MISRPVGSSVFSERHKAVVQQLQAQHDASEKEINNAALGAFGDVMIAWFWPMFEAFSKIKGEVDERKRL